MTVENVTRESGSIPLCGAIRTVYATHPIPCAAADLIDSLAEALTGLLSFADAGNSERNYQKVLKARALLAEIGGNHHG